MSGPNDNNENKVAIKGKFTYLTKSGIELTLTKEIVQKYVAGDVKISDQEFNMFFQLCKEYRVNPFIKEAYLVKYGSSPATIVLDYKVLQQIADSHTEFDGLESGVITTKGEDGEPIYRKGQLVMPGETLVAGWCKVFRKDRTHPTEKVCLLKEFQQKKKSGELNSNWAGKPAFMIEKVAKAQALREAFPNSFQSNIYSAEEATTFSKENTIDTEYDHEIVDQKEDEIKVVDIDKL